MCVGGSGNRKEALGPNRYRPRILGHGVTEQCGPGDVGHRHQRRLEPTHLFRQPGDILPRGQGDDPETIGKPARNVQCGHPDRTRRSEDSEMFHGDRVAARQG